ncbi:MAG: hypothetical protein ACD_21C00156G0008 [uncultured bacterium]|nr:MAG: hypothetical protein ACD_21C00156G0008 [uncultured bacterium]
MSKAYTKSGDDGFTNLGSGKRVKKYSDVIELYGCIEELNVFLGYAAEFLCHREEFHDLFRQIDRIQRELFELGEHLLSSSKFAINPHKISKLEIEMDAMSERLPVLHSSLLPGGGEDALRIHLARTVCRRTERAAFKFAENTKNAEIIGIYFNRLSNWLYAAARTAALIANVEENVF